MRFAFGSLSAFAVLSFVSIAAAQQSPADEGPPLASAQAPFDDAQTAPAQPAAPPTAPPDSYAQGYGASAAPALPPPPVEEPTPGIGLTINPLAMIFGTFNLELEARLASPVSLFVGPEFVTSGDVTAFGATFGLRLFMLGQAIEGFWISPEFGAYYASGLGASAVGYTAGALLGYTFVWGHFVLSIGGGVRYMELGVSSGAASASVSGVRPALRLSIGVAF